MIVDFPDPFWPTRPWTSPGPTSRSTSCSTVRPENVFDRFSSRSPCSVMDSVTHPSRLTKAWAEPPRGVPHPGPESLDAPEFQIFRLHVDRVGVREGGRSVALVDHPDRLQRSRIRGHRLTAEVTSECVCVEPAVVAQGADLSGRHLTILDVLQRLLAAGTSEDHWRLLDTCSLERFWQATTHWVGRDVDAV